MTDKTEEGRFAAARQQTSDWLLAEGWQISELTDRAEGSAWAIRGVDTRGRRIVFAQAANKPDRLVMQASITVDKASRALLDKLGSERNDELAWRIRFQLVNMGVKFAHLNLPLERFTLITRVYTDDLQRNGFFDRLDRLLDGVNASIWLIRRALAQPAPRDVGSDALDIN